MVGSNGTARHSRAPQGRSAGLITARATCAELTSARAREGPSARHRWDDAELVPSLQTRFQPSHRTDILVVAVDVYEMAQPASSLEQARLEARKGGLQPMQDLSDRGPLRLNLCRSTGERTQRIRNPNPNAHEVFPITRQV